MDDSEARLLALALNNIEGTEDPAMRAEALRQILETIPQGEVIGILPESVESLRQIAELTPVDLDDNPRFNADEADFDPGCGVPVVVDMGSYEYQFDPVDEVFLGDLNGDGTVGIKDLLVLLSAWGPSGEECELADLDLDGEVGITDLLILLGNWD